MNQYDNLGQSWTKKQESRVWVQIPSLLLSTPQFRIQLDLSKVQIPHWKTRELVVESFSDLNRLYSSPESLHPISFQLVPSPSCWVMRLKFKQSMQNCPSSREPPKGCTSSPLPGELPAEMCWLTPLLLRESLGVALAIKSILSTTDQAKADPHTHVWFHPCSTLYSFLSYRSFLSSVPNKTHAMNHCHRVYNWQSHLRHPRISETPFLLWFIDDNEDNIFWSPACWLQELQRIKAKIKFHTFCAFWNPWSLWLVLCSVYLKPITWAKWNKWAMKQEALPEALGRHIKGLRKTSLQSTCQWCKKSWKIFQGRNFTESEGIKN